MAVSGEKATHASVNAIHVTFSYSLCTDTADLVPLKDVREKTQKMSPKVKHNPSSFHMSNAYQRVFSAPHTEKKFHLPANLHVVSFLYFFPNISYLHTVYTFSPRQASKEQKPSLPNLSMTTTIDNNDDDDGCDEYVTRMSALIYLTFSSLIFVI